VHEWVETDSALEPRSVITQKVRHIAMGRFMERNGDEGRDRPDRYFVQDDRNRPIHPASPSVRSAFMGDRSNLILRKQKAAGCVQPPNSCVVLEVATLTDAKARNYFFFFAFFFFAFFAMVELHC